MISVDCLRVHRVNSPAKSLLLVFSALQVSYLPAAVSQVFPLPHTGSVLVNGSVQVLFLLEGLGVGAQLGIFSYPLGLSSLLLCVGFLFSQIRVELAIQAAGLDFAHRFCVSGFRFPSSKTSEQISVCFPSWIFFSCSVHLLASRAPAFRSDLSCSSESGFVWVCGHVFVVITLLVISLCSQLVILQERELVQGSSVWFSAMERFTQLMAESLHSAL